jgi:hypothetical protein
VNIINPLILLILFIVPLSAQENIPDNIYFKTLAEGFSHANLYALRDGKLWIKENGRISGSENAWKLFGGTGLPGGKDAESFKNDDRIVQFSTEATMIAAVSNRGRFYLWQPTLKDETTWSDVTGSPVEDALYLPPNRCWAFSMSVMRAPWKRKTPMPEEDIVSYWEDADGNKTEFGFTATIYSVDPDGQRIRYTDTGLPASWHKAFASPERGTFIIENISASASTLFVINKTGKMYTRLFDYEVEGGCPALIFVYDHQKRNNDRTMPLMESVRTLPIPDWKEQPAIRDVQEGKGSITGKITILLTGKGNAARELRVQGRDAGGKYGYWMKPLLGAGWTFIETGESFSDDHIISDYLAESVPGKTLDKNYSGTMTRWLQEPLSVELIGFYYYNTPCILRVHRGNTHFDLRLHTVDMWSPTVQKKFYPWLVGNPSGEPKLLQGTIEIPENILNSDNKDIKEIIDNYFRDYQKVPFALNVRADDRTVRITSRLIQRRVNLEKDYESHTPIEMNFINESEPEGGAYYSKIAGDPDLTVPANQEALTNNDILLIDEKISRNEKTIKAINDLVAEFKKNNLKAGTFSFLGFSAFSFFNGAVSAVQIPHWDIPSDDPAVRENIIQFGGVSYTGGAPMLEHAKMNMSMSAYTPEDYYRAIAVLNNNIAQLGKLRESILQKNKIR